MGFIPDTEQPPAEKMPARGGFTPDALPSPEQATSGTGFMGALFPSTQMNAGARKTDEQIAIEKQQAIEKMGPWGALARPEAGEANLMGLMTDVTSFTTRAAEGIRRMFAGQGIAGFVNALQDPEASVFQVSREEGQQFWIDLAEKSGNPVEKKLFQTLGLINQAGWGAIEDPASYLFPAKALAGKAKAIKFKGVGSKDLVNSGGFPVTPAQSLGKETSSIETYMQANPFTNEFPLNIKKRQMEVLEETTSKISKDLGGDPADLVGQGGAVRGALILKKLKDVDNISKKTFQKGEKKIKKALGEKPINFEDVDLFDDRSTFYTNSLGKHVKRPVKTIYKSNAMTKMEDYLGRVGHTTGETPKNTLSISSKTIAKAEKYYDEIAEARSVTDLLNVKRNIADEVFDNTQKGFLTGKKNIGYLRGINKLLNDSIEETILTLSPGMKGEYLADVFRAINKRYEQNLDDLMNAGRKFGANRKDFKSEGVLGKIKLLGSNDLLRIKKAASKRSEIRPFYKEIQRGAYEDFIYNSLDLQTMKISTTKMVSSWEKIDKEIKKALFPDNVIAETDKLVRTLRKINSGDLAKLNPSGTGKVNFITKVWKNPADAIPAILMRPVAKRYYSKGKLPHESIFNLLRGSDGKLYLTTEKLAKIRNAESLGNFIRSETRGTDKGGNK